MKKKYPPTIMMRKRLILIVIIGLGLLIALIIYNLYHGNSSSIQPISKKSPAIPDVANAMDIAWFNDQKNDPKIAKIPLAHVALMPPVHPLPISINPDQHAAQTPITSNQIRAEPITKSEETTNSHPSDTIKNHETSDAHGTDTQAEKKAFLIESEQKPQSYLRHAIEEPRSAYEIKTGTIIPAILISGINSDLPGPIIAQVRENIYDTVAGRYLMIPQGTKLQGVYDSSVAYGQQRVLIAWQRLIFPNGQSLQLSGMPGTDVSGYAGFKDQVNNHYGRLFGSALLMSMISAGLQLSQPPGSNNNNSQPSPNQILAQNVGISLSQTTDQLLRKNLNIQPTLEIRPGYLFNISVTQDILLPGPYVILKANDF